MMQDFCSLSHILLKQTSKMLKLSKKKASRKATNASSSLRKLMIHSLIFLFSHNIIVLDSSSSRNCTSSASGRKHRFRNKRIQRLN